MEVRNCRRCRRLFNYLSGPIICPDCKDASEKKFYDVKEFIRDNPHCNVQEVSEAMGVSTSQISHWVREERLQFAEESGIALQCDKCGKNIYTGRYCDECKAKLLAHLAKAGPKPTSLSPDDAKQLGGMHFKR